MATRAVIEEMLASKRAANRRDVYVNSLALYLNRFAKVYEDIAVSSATVETWLSQFKAAYSRQTWMNRLSTLFSFAVRRGYIPFNPCDRIDRVVVDRSEPKILTIGQVTTLLNDCPDNLRAYLVLALFAGIRPDGELMKMTWDHVNLETATVSVNFPKTRKHRRNIQLQPVAIELLKRCPNKNGPIAPSRSTVRRWKRKVRIILGYGRYPADILRHTAASFMVELYDDVAKVARILGNSPQILLTHYHVPVSKPDCKKFWGMHLQDDSNQVELNFNGHPTTN